MDEKRLQEIGDYVDSMPDTATLYDDLTAGDIRELIAEVRRLQPRPLVRALPDRPVSKPDPRNCTRCAGNVIIYSGEPENRATATSVRCISCGDIVPWPLPEGVTRATHNPWER